MFSAFRLSWPETPAFLPHISRQERFLSLRLPSDKQLDSVMSHINTGESRLGQSSVNLLTRSKEHVFFFRVYRV